MTSKIARRMPVLFINPFDATVKKGTIDGAKVNREIKDFLGFTQHPVDFMGEKREYYITQLEGDLYYFSESAECVDIPLVPYWAYAPSQMRFNNDGVILRIVDKEYHGLHIGEETDKIISSISFYHAHEHPLSEEYDDSPFFEL
jgi:hypothetical protein